MRIPLLPLLLQNVLLLHFSTVSILCRATTTAAEDLTVPGLAKRPHGMPCHFEHRSPWQRLKLLDPADGLPFVNEGGLLKKASAVLKAVPEYRLEVVEDAPSGVYDLKLGKEFLALYDDGSLGFARKSSRGTNAAKHGKKRFMTTIFTVSCVGDLSIALPDSRNYGFARHNSTKLVYVHPTAGLQHARHKRSAATPFLERTVTAATLVAGDTNPFAFLAAPLPTGPPQQLNPFSWLAGPTLITDYFQKGWSPRCVAQVPFGLTSMVKPGARAAFFNGCGAENGVKFPDLRFKDCCNQHDLCYDDCTATWETCNDAFRACNHRACDAIYPYLANESWWSIDPVRWGCNTLADTYADGVGTPVGAWAFNASTAERCECKCPAASRDCGKYCMVECQEINEAAVVEVRKGEPGDYALAVDGSDGVG